MKCSVCPCLLDRTADLWVRVDEQGHQLGDDPDVTHLQPDLFAYLAALAELCVTGTTKRKCLDRRATGEYSAIKVRLETGGAWPVHQLARPGPVCADTLPWRGVSARCLRPPIWQCRQCGAPVTLERAA